eukprot:1327623-Pyramimonas_sp.AAC.1
MTFTLTHKCVLVDVVTASPPPVEGDPLPQASGSPAAPSTLAELECTHSARKRRRTKSPKGATPAGSSLLLAAKQALFRLAEGGAGRQLCGSYLDVPQPQDGALVVPQPQDGAA